MSFRRTSFSLCDCMSQPFHSLFRWAAKRCSLHTHQRMTQCQEETIAEVVVHQHNQPVIISSRPLTDKIATPEKPIREINPVSISKKRVEQSFEDEILLRTENQPEQSTNQQSQERGRSQTLRFEPDQLGQYYELFSAKVGDIEQKLSLTGTLLTIEQPPGRLQVSYIESDNLNIFIYNFSLPCSYAYYSKMMNDCDLQKQLDPNLDEYRVQEVVSQQARVNYIAYKKVLIVSPRDFVSLKCILSLGQEHWEVATSIPGPAVPNRVRGEIILNAVRVKEVSNKKQINIRVYSEVNMKLSVRPKLTRNQSLTQIRKYVERCLKHIEQNPDI